MTDRVMSFRNSEIYLYGAGQIGHEVACILKNDLSGIFDKRYKELRSLIDIPIINPVELMKLNPTGSIIIVSVNNSISEPIMHLVEKLGWKRNTNLFMLGKDFFCESDYLDLCQTQSKEIIFKYLSGYERHLKACKFCNGLYGINDNRILVGEQLR